LDDARQLHADTPILLAGDFNLDVSGGPAAPAIERAQFQDAFANLHALTISQSFLEQGQIIDWIFIRGPIRASQAEVYRSVSASDPTAFEQVGLRLAGDGQLEISSSSSK
jgi:endonuclease/exonuclease/phosphatase family metal-dependent hydrolase